MPNSHSDLAELIERYQKVLKKEASPQALGETLSLVKAIADSRLDEPRESSPFEAEAEQVFPPDAIEVIEPTLKEIRLNRQRLRLSAENQRMVYQIVAALTLPALIRAANPAYSRARSSLLIDATQVLFHQSYFVLVVNSGITSVRARNILLDAFLRYAERLPSSADSFRTLSLVLDAKGQHDAAVAFARKSLQETRPDAHEYLTVLQTAWSAYIDRGQFQLAILVLLEEFIDKRVIASNFEEFRQLIELTLEMWHATLGGKALATSD